MSAANHVDVLMDNTPEIFKSIEEILGHEILVGIPEDKTTRQDDEKSPITNAALAYIHEFGSPAANIPARPFLIPGVQKARRASLYQLKLAVEAAMDGDADKALQKMFAAGVVASNSVRDTLLAGEGYPPLSPETIRNRSAQRGDATPRQSEMDYLKFVSQGVDPAAAQEEVGITPLINTGQMFNAITFVVRPIDGSDD